ncbi:MAG TPA: CBS domain-containing protein [Patescibacteria group bacterium]|nr:CBS domain-containing protein [Patescibacteria group bacterium]
MKIASVIHKTPVTIDEHTPIKEGAQLIFSLGLSAIPITRGKKLVGILTQHDLLSRMYPSIQEIIEDFAHAADFEHIEQNITQLLEGPVSQIMNKKMITATAETPLMQAQSLMLVHKFSHLPIINDKQELLGIVSQGDIFRRLLRNEMPRLEKQRYATFVGQHYDLMVNWRKRMNYEYPILEKEFKKAQIKKILDIGVWTGEYTVRLAKKGRYTILGLDENTFMIEICNKKREKLTPALKKRVSFMLSDFTRLSDKLPTKYDAVICMGNALPHVSIPLQQLFKEVSTVLRSDKPLIIIQMLNFEKIIKMKNRLISFIIQKSKNHPTSEHLTLEYFDCKKGGGIIHNVIVFTSDGKNWIFKGITRIKVRNIKKIDIETSLKKAGFDDITFSGNSGEYQGEYGELSFDTPFKPQESDWLNVRAQKTQ